MSAPQPQWIWDPNRQAYYWVFNGLYHYQDGTVIDVQGTVVSSPGDSSHTTARSTSQDESDLVTACGGFNIANSPSVGQTYGYPPNASYQGQVEESSTTESPQAATPTIYIKGTPGKVEPLHSGYKLNPKIFQLGRVFKVLWSEPMGAAQRTNNPMPSNISQVTFGESAHSKIAWFVVIVPRRTWSLCLRIQTYGGQGCKKPGVENSEHAIIHTGSTAPNPFPEETGMLSPIRVTTGPRGARLDPQSRLNLAKVYTVEHNVKVYDFGSVHRDYMELFRESWEQVFRGLKQTQTTDQATAGLTGIAEDLVANQSVSFAPHSSSTMSQAPSSQAMHNVLVKQYTVYLRDEESEEAAFALLGGEYPDQIKIYTTCMGNGITPEKPQHDLLVAHYIQVCRGLGEALKPHRRTLERGTPEEQASVYAGLIAAGIALPTREAP